MYRVYDNEKNEFLDGEYYLSPLNDVTVFNKGLFRKRIDLLSSERYIFQRDIGLQDKDGRLIYEGDVLDCKNEDKSFTGTVVYSPDIASYIVLDFDNKKYYPLGKDYMQFVKVIGFTDRGND